MIMKFRNKISIILLAAVALSSCSNDFLDPWESSLASEQKAFELTAYLNNMPTTAYSYLPKGFNSIGSSYMTSATDESENVDDMQSIQLFNAGTWNKFNNPDDVWSDCYKGLRIANDYIQGTDTLTWSKLRYSFPDEYARRMVELTRNRGEMHFLRGMFYFELFKRYGAVPLLKDKVKLAGLDVSKYPQAPVDSIVKYIVDECDLCTSRGKYALTQTQKDAILQANKNVLPSPYRDTVALYYNNTDQFASRQFRATIGSALALKAKALIYAASPQFNPSGNVEKWKLAAAACKDVIDLTTKYPSKYKLSTSYADLFQPTSWGFWNNEYLFARTQGSSNSFDKANAPISIQGGATGTCPTGNLVDAYEMADGTNFSWSNPTHAASPYANRDKRLGFTIFTNNEKYNNATTIDIWQGGTAAPPIFRSTKTGYYLKKYINQSLNLNAGGTANKAWSVMRLADFYLFYAEAMNEAYGPTAIPPGYTLSALQALNAVRARVAMPPVIASTASQLKARIIRERQIELAFEDARYWDLRRWKLAEDFLKRPIHGVTIVKNPTTGVFTYTPNVFVENRVFDATKMYLHPIPQTEIDKSGGVLMQNINW
jgi:hypothetical protein